MSDPAQASLAVSLTRIMFPYLLLVGLAAMATGILNSQGRFFASAIGPAVLNVGMIAAVLLLPRYLDRPIVSLAIGVLAGGVGQLLVQIPSLAACGLLVMPSRDLRHPGIARITRLLLPAVFGLAAVQLMVFVNTLLASLLPLGSISYLYYADRVMEFPLGVFGIALASASLPVMSRHAAAQDHRGLTDTLNFALRLAFYVSLPATVGLIVLRAPIVRVLFERGRFGPVETAATAEALAWYAIGLAGFAGSRIVAQTFYARGDAATAVRWGVVSVVANVVAALALMGPLGHAGLAGAASVGAYVNLVSLLVIARLRLGRLGGRALVQRRGANPAGLAAAGRGVLARAGAVAGAVVPGDRRRVAVGHDRRRRRGLLGGERRARHHRAHRAPESLPSARARRRRLTRRDRRRASRRARALLDCRALVIESDVVTL